ncbi:MAG TPA: hypothetical protein VGG72_02910 [Bryobacteraceae bacterium]|jgi:hypothetical protein
MAAITGVKQIVGSVALAVLAQPIHEFGHAVALWASTGFWPRVGVLSVQPLGSVSTKAAALSVLAAGDFAVLAWWGLIFAWMQRGRQRDWAVIGTTFVVFVVLLEWLTAAVMFPFSRANLGGSDAAKLLEISGLEPWSAAAFLGTTVMIIGTATALLLRSALKSHLGDGRG